MGYVKNLIIKVMLIIVLLFTSQTVFSQIINYKTVAFSINQYDELYHKWTGWSSWEKSNMLLTINFDTSVVTVYSPVTQIYSIYKSEGNYYDSDNDYHMVFKFIDQDNDRGTMRLLQRHSGESEIYIEFADIKWCYTVLKL